MWLFMILLLHCAISCSVNMQNKVRYITDIIQVYTKQWIKHDLRSDGVLSADVYESKMQQSSNLSVEFNIVTELKQTTKKTLYLKKELNI